MSQIKNKHYILTAIEQLRSRKSRPDINRICKYLLKFYKVTPKETKSDLRRCIKEKSVIKVEYKDNVSYRNAATWKKDRKKSKSKKMSSETAGNHSGTITSAISTLIYHNQKYLDSGIPIEDLIKSVYDSTDYSKKKIEAIILKELSLGSLMKLPNGNLSLGASDQDADSSDSMKLEYVAEYTNKANSSLNSSTRSSPLRMRGRPKKRGGGTMSNSTPSSSAAVRVGERRKMAKKVFDPSDNNMPNKRKRGRPVGSLNKSTIKKQMYAENPKGSRDNQSMRSESQPSNDDSTEELEQETIINETSGVCTVCLVQKPRGSNEKLVECRDCSNKAHLSCLQSETGMLKLHPDNSWQCPHCKTCVVCLETNDAGVLTVCSVCSDAYHVECHSPRIPDGMHAWDHWKCNNCSANSHALLPAYIQQSQDKQKEKNPFLKPHEIETNKSKLSEDMPIDPSIPDISNWTTEKVCEYFEANLPKVASVLKEQDMDGEAILMATRADIVKGLDLPLGPALALYQIVVKLQTRKDDWTMCWG